MTPVLIFLTAIALGLITAGIAKWKGRRPMAWLLYGAVGSVVVMPFLLTLDRRPSDDTRFPWAYYLAAMVLLAVVCVLWINQQQNAVTFEN